MTPEIRLGDVIRTRKPHPCGCDTWLVIRIGADIKIKCQQCGRIVMLDRDAFLKRRKAILSQGPEPAAQCPGPLPKETEPDAGK